MEIKLNLSPLSILSFVGLAAAAAILNITLFHDWIPIAIAAGLIVIVALIAVIIFSRPAKPTSAGTAAIKAIAGLATTFPGWAPVAKKGATLLPASIGSNIPNQHEQIIPIIVFALSSVSIAIVAIMASKPPLDSLSTNSNSPFKERTYTEKFNKTIQSMRNSLALLDFSSNWTEQSFEPLEAEVEDISGRERSSRKIRNLLSTLSRDRKTRVFLVIGEPGSGKVQLFENLPRTFYDHRRRRGLFRYISTLKSGNHQVKRRLKRLMHLIYMISLKKRLGASRIFT